MADFGTAFSALTLVLEKGTKAMLPATVLGSAFLVFAPRALAEVFHLGGIQDQHAAYAGLVLLASLPTTAYAFGKSWFDGRPKRHAESKRRDERAALERFIDAQDVETQDLLWIFVRTGRGLRIEEFLGRVTNAGERVAILFNRGLIEEGLDRAWEQPIFSVSLDKLAVLKELLDDRQKAYGEKLIAKQREEVNAAS